MMRIDPRAVVPGDLAAAAEWLRHDGIVAFPTDTVYGLAVDPASSVAVQRLFDLKGRDGRAALPLIAASMAQVVDLCGPLTGGVALLAAAFWPGPLSLIVAAPPGLSADVHGGAGTIAIRVPDHAIARALAEAAGRPLTATSANRSGRPPAATAAELGDLAADPGVLVIDGGRAPGGPPSTIVDARQRPPILVREGAVAWKRVLESLQG
jgi:L-threonylcarbamoyladenylate synthase